MSCMTARLPSSLRAHSLAVRRVWKWEAAARSLNRANGLLDSGSEGAVVGMVGSCGYGEDVSRTPHHQNPCPGWLRQRQNAFPGALCRQTLWEESRAYIRGSTANVEECMAEDDARLQSDVEHGP